MVDVKFAHLQRLLTCMLLAASAVASDFPYDETVDAHVDVDRAFATAQTKDRPVMILFGANWCTDCRVLDAAMGTEPLAGAIGVDLCRRQGRHRQLG
ncbi:MAG: thioredoxin family protein [Gammaproteobacteria bacterium]|nr:thioredoxin family protein [Gammaproteobacteria bacterium]